MALCCFLCCCLSVVFVGVCVDFCGVVLFVLTVCSCFVLSLYCCCAFVWCLFAFGVAFGYFVVCCLVFFYLRISRCVGVYLISGCSLIMSCCLDAITIYFVMPCC